MTPEQSRAARGWLAWSQTQLAEAAKTGVSTVKDFEGGRRKPIQSTLGAMQAALERGGIAFVDGDDGALGISFKEVTVDADSRV